MKGRVLIAGTAVAALLVPAAAGADHGDCHVHVLASSATDPHMSDPADDWGGVVFGGGTAEHPEGDIYREGTDVTAGWIHREGDGRLTAHIQVASMTVGQPNRVFYFRWNYEGTDSASYAERTKRFVSLRDEGDKVTGTYGYLDETGTLGVFRTVGETPASAVVGTPGELIIDIPATGTAADPLNGETLDNANWGAPTSTLEIISAESRLIVGSPKPLPPNPAGVRHGLVRLIDSTQNADFICAADV